MKKRRRLLSLPALLLVCMACCLAQKLMAQEKVVSGTVTDANGDPLIGVNVLVKESPSLGTITDMDGKFSLHTENGQTLVFTYIGYAPHEVALTGKSMLQVQMREDSEALEEIVVIGYGAQKKSTLSGAISSLKSDDLVRTTTATVSGALVGKTPGITARQADGRPGASTSIQIRNMGKPLYVINGVPSEEGQFNNLDVNDIESISILKDASAAIYGLRAANGVVLITTKGGKREQKSSISATGYYGIQNLMRYPEPADAATYYQAKMEQDLNMYGSTNRTKEELLNWQNGTNQGFDWYDFIVRQNSPVLYGNINASGGSENMNYYFSASHINQQAAVEGFNFKRTTIQANVDANITKNLKVGTRINARIEERHNVGVPGLDDYWQPYFAIFKNDPTVQAYANGNKDYVNTTQDIYTGAAIFDKDITGYTDDIWKSATINLFAEYDLPLKGLKLRGAFNYWIADNKNEQFEYTYNTYTYDKETDTYNVTGSNQNPWRRRVFEERQELTYQLQLNYANSFGSHNLSGVAGLEAFERKRNYTLYNTLPPNNYIDLTYLDDMTGLTHEVGESARAGAIFRLAYDYAGKYIVEFSGRYDGSYLFKSGSRWGFFPAVSAGWRLSEEAFMQGWTGDKLSNLKLRASWGQMGDDQYNDSDIVTPYSYLDGYNYGSRTAVLNGSTVTGVRPRGLPITTLSWIKSTLINVGLDYGFFNNQLSGTVEMFKRKRTGLPASRYDVLIPVEVGFELPQENLNTDAHYGVEASIAWMDKIDRVNYSIGGNVTLSRKKDLYDYNARFGSSWDYYRNSTVNRWANINWGYESTGQFQSVDEIKNYPVDIDGVGNSTLIPGDLIIKDVNGDGIINYLDERPIGYATGQQPYLSFGINGSVAWNNFDLQFDFAGATMQTYATNWEIKIPFQAINSPHYILNDAWHHADPTDVNSAWIPGCYPAVRTGGSHVNWTRHSTFWTTNIAYLKLRTLELGYTLPKHVTKRFRVNHLRFFVNGYNLFSIDNMGKYEVDPEISMDSGLVTPNLRTFSFGFNINL